MIHQTAGRAPGSRAGRQRWCKLRDATVRREDFFFFGGYYNLMHHGAETCKSHA
jgi:hypothetical protein